MKMLSVQVEDKLAKEIDSLIRRSGMYSSRSEFLKDAIRKNIMEFSALSDDQLKIRLGVRKLALKSYERGWRGEMPTQEERSKIADEYLKENRINSR